MGIFSLILLVAAFVCFVLAAFNLVVGKINLVATGLALLTAVQLIAAAT